MKPLRTILASLGAALALTAAPSVAAAEPAAVHDPCTGTYHGDARLGPKYLPRKWQAPVGPLLKGYHRTGGLDDRAFLKKYWDGPADGGSWKYPPNDGFTETNGEVDRTPTALAPGEELDRFGSEYGAYLAPAGDAYEKRALPPQNLNTRDAAYACDYHTYVVEKAFVVWEGPIAPWFEQPGGGRQIKLDAAFLNPGEGQRLNVKWLIEHDYLEPTV
ncbi:TNT domain-containing protein [Streptomyces sp. Q6]|uniref:TNT domain-containing protein n=1 Tax=Streptomyces citrinus TaxID=3118173 RepID=A0ACD5AMS1_9ACTN